MELPRILQGGMGVGISGWRLARAVSLAGGLGVVSGTALDVLLARRLESGDPGGHLRRALARLPLADVARRILERHFVPGGKPVTAAFRTQPLLDAPLSPEREESIVAANFAEVWLAREGHGRPVGVNYLEKIQIATLPSLWGAMLAGAGAVCMGAGLPRAIPRALDGLARGEVVELDLDVLEGGRRGRERLAFDPRRYGASPPTLRRPDFLGIVSSATAAAVLVRRCEGRVDGLVVEAPSAGGHNAPERGRSTALDLEAIAALARPFWLAGGCGRPDALSQARRRGAQGIQVGTAFAFCRESGLDPELRARAMREILAGACRVRTDLHASPTGFPFKVLELEGTLSDARVAARRRRVCDLGYLRHARRTADGRLQWRCPGEPERAWRAKGGHEDELAGRLCLCNALLAATGLGQVRRTGAYEPAVLTAGDDLEAVAECVRAYGPDYCAADVIARLSSGPD